MAAIDETTRKLQLKEFQRNAQRLLTEDDRDYLHYVLKEYQTYKSVDKLVIALRSCLDSPKKLDLLIDIRNLIPLAHLSRFDNIAPYHKMLHPFKPPNQVSPDRKTPSLKRDHNDSSSLDSVGSFRVVSLVKSSPEQSLGFSIRGGREHNTPLSISQVDENSPASKQNLRVGDQLIEVNGIDLEHITHSSAVSLLASLNKLKMVVRTSVKVQSFENDSPRSNTSLGSNGYTTWVSVKDGKPIPNGTVENGSLQSSGSTSHSIALQQHTHLLNGADERRVNLTVEETPTGFIGFNIRGGAEYGLGIYISRVDEGSLAQEAGFQVGDQILDVNGKSFETILHKNAVEHIKAQKHIVVTLKAVGRLPEARHYYSELSWVYPDGSIVKDSKKNEGSQPYSAPDSPVSPLELSNSSTQFPDYDYATKLNSRAEIGCQTPDLSPENIMEMVPMSKEAVEVQTVATDLERSQSSKSIATSSTSSGGENEKRQSTYSSYSGDSLDGRDERINSVSSRDDIILMASDNESRKGGEKKVKKSKSFLQKHGDKIKSKLSFRKKNKQRIDIRDSMAMNYNEYNQLPRGPPIFEKGFGTQLMIGGTNQQQMMLYIEEKARKTLVVDEYNAVVRHMKVYQEQGDVELLVNNMLAILDKPEKALLLRDIRTLVSPYDLGRFDAMVSAREKEALDYLSTCVPGSPTIIPTAVEKPKRQLVAAIQDSKGSFQLRSEEEIEKIRLQKEELEKKRTATAWLGGSILSRDEGRRSHENLKAIPNSYPMDVIPTRDSGTSNISLPVIQERRQETITWADPVTMSAIHNFPEDDIDDIDSTTAEDGDTSSCVSDELSSTNSAHTPIQELLEEKAKPNALLVPDRVMIEYKDEEDEVKNSHNGFSLAASNGAISVPIPSISVSTTDNEINSNVGKHVTIMLPKKRTSLGISISGGKGSRTQPEIRVEKVFPGGAASDDGRLMNGDEVVSVDGSSLSDVTHAEAVDIIRRSYNNKAKEVMEIVVIKRA